MPWGRHWAWLLLLITGRVEWSCVYTVAAREAARSRPGYASHLWLHDKSNTLHCKWCMLVLSVVRTHHAQLGAWL